MGKEARYRKKDTFEGPVDSVTVIEPGDMVWLDTDDYKPASAFTWDTDLAKTQGEFRSKFAGIAITGSPAGDTKPIVIARPGYGFFEMDMDSDSYVAGALVGPAKNPDADLLMNQKLDDAVGAGAIAKVVEAVPASSTRALCQFESVLMGIGIVPQAAVVAALSTTVASGDVDTGAEVATVINATNTAVNAILAALKNAGVIASS